MKKYCLLLAMLLGCSTTWAQGVFFLDETTHGSTLNVGTSTYIKCTGVDSMHSVGRGYDYWITVVGNCVGDTGVFHLVVDELDLRLNTMGGACADTLFVYDGVDTSADVIWFATGNTMFPSVNQIAVSRSNTAQALTLRFKVCNDCGPWNHATGRGFSMKAECKKPCDPFVPVLDSVFYKTRNGVVYEFGTVKHLFDTVHVKVWDSVVMDSVLTIDSGTFDGVNLCMGDGVIFTAHGDYAMSSGWYTPSDATTTFTWDMGSNDTIEGVGLNSVHYEEYYKIACYEMILTMTDVNGCTSAIHPQVRVRVAKNPLKTVFTLQDICNRDSLLVNIGYGGENATLILDSIVFSEGDSKTYDVKTFIPDGPHCSVNCYESLVTFSDFPSGSRVLSGDDVCSVCINYEHSFMGDYRLELVCPEGRSAVLKYGTECNYSGQTNCDPLVTSSTPQGSYGGSGRYTGIPYGGNNDGTYDNISGNYCDSIYNMYGVGYDYCFSRNAKYTLASGNNAATTSPIPADYIADYNSNAIQVTQTFITIPAPYVQAGTTAPQSTVMTKKPSDHEGKMDYYLPADNFDKLIGCSLNGDWSVKVCDFWGSDNGWVFSWSLDICNVSQGGCKYQVDIDSLIWEPDTSAQYHDYELGRYRGLEVHRHNDLESYVMTPDTAGTFPINVKIYDEFGCVWDTNTKITTYWTPKPTLGNDTTLCGVTTTLLDATDRHAATENYTYLWEPFGQDSSKITTRYEPGSDIRYIAQVTNTRRSTVCVTRDTIDVKLRTQPYPSFVPTPFTLEGCSPLTLTFDNQTLDAKTHFWDFGDGVTSEQASPTHTYTEGVYDLKYYVTSGDGCKDSLIYDSVIAVYASPKASFAWDPIYPSVLHPVAQLTNTTANRTADTKFFWEMQYNRNNLLSVQTLTDENPLFDFSQFASPDELAGTYTARLIARTDNMAPSGNIIYCRDTTESTIMLVNDFLQFPNVVTPNGDGINDKFVISNLIGGLAYPVNTLDIYNKWGTRIFHRENITAEEDFWDPVDVPAGTYFYRFSARGYNGNIEHNGAVEVIK